MLVPSVILSFKLNPPPPPIRVGEACGVEVEEVESSPELELDAAETSTEAEPVLTGVVGDAEELGVPVNEISAVVTVAWVPILFWLAAAQ
jgi:hypothetical protein